MDIKGGAGQAASKPHQFKQVLDTEQEEAQKLVIKTFMDPQNIIKVKDVVNIKNRDLEKRFLKFQEAINRIPGAKSEIVTKLHGTYTQNVSGIQQEGFKLPTSYKRSHEDQEGHLNFGKAIYVSSFSSKASCYGEGVILVCDVILGKVKIMNQTETKLDHSDAERLGFHSIYFNGNLQPKKDEILAGAKCDEYALFYQEQIFPKFAVHYVTHAKDGSEVEIKYTGKHTFENTNFNELIQALDGPEQYSKVAFRIMGDLSRDFNRQMTQYLDKKSEEFFSFSHKALTHDSEQLTHQVLRVFWNSSYQNQFLQDLIGKNLDINLLISFIESPHASIRERVCGVIQNLTSLSESNANLYAKRGVLNKLLEIAMKWKTGQAVQALLSAMGALGNISSFVKLERGLLTKIYETLEPLLDCDNQEVQDEVIRLLSNQIGVGKEWKSNDYKASVALEKF